MLCKKNIHRLVVAIKGFKRREKGRKTLPFLEGRSVMKLTNEKNKDVTSQKKTEEKKNVKRPLIIYDLVIIIIASELHLILYRGRENLSATGII